MTCGPWRPVRLETYKARISDIRVDYSLGSDLKTASGTIKATVEGNAGKTVSFSGELGGTVAFTSTSQLDQDGVATVEFQVKDPKLWYPHGYGEQPLYTVTATVKDDDIELHSSSRRIGFRKGELIQQPDEIGKSFYFRINDIDVFCGGSDWIPADSFLPSITEERYRKWLNMMVDGYQLMIRYVCPVSSELALAHDA
jgi:beta-mannosidase